MAEEFRQGHKRDTTNDALLVVHIEDALQPIEFSNGFLRDANGVLVVTHG
jgi:hypothetical protein